MVAHLPHAISNHVPTRTSKSRQGCRRSQSFPTPPKDVLKDKFDLRNDYPSSQSLLVPTHFRRTPEKGFGILSRLLKHVVCLDRPRHQGLPKYPAVKRRQPAPLAARVPTGQ